MKKISAYILVLAMLVSCLTAPVYAADSADEVYYLTEAQYGFVKAMGSTYGNDYSAFSGTFTRGQVCRVISYFGNFGHGGTPTEYEALFHDLSTDDYYYPYIKACYDGGIITGYPDGTFRSEQPMTTKDVARLLAYCIGYKEYINVAGLDAVLSKTGIMDGVPVTDAATQGMIYRMMYNTYHAPACVADSVSSAGNVEYSISEEYLGMELLEKVKYAKGIADGAVGTTLESPDDSMIDGLISIDGTVYEYDGDSTELLGYHVEYYYQTGLNNRTDGNKIIFAAKTNSNKEFVIKDADLGGYSNFKYTYYKNNRAETVDISERTDVIMNGIANPTYTDADMLPGYGAVTLIDNDKTAPGYDVVKIESYEFFLVDNVDTNKKIIYDQSENIAALNMEDADVINIRWNGDDYPMERIIYGNFLKVKRTNPKSGYYLVDIEVLKDEKNNVTVLSANNDTINETGMSHTLWTNLSDESRKYLKSGETVTLYFSDGIVVRVEGAKNDDSIYGYLMNVAADGVLNPTIVFRIMQASATAVSYEMGKSIKIDGTTYSDFNSIASALYTSAQASNVYDESGELSYYAVDDTAPYAQPVKYKINAKGHISSIDTVVNGANEDPDKKLTALEPITQRYYKATGSGNVYHEGTLHLASFLASSTKIMIPATGRNDEDNYKPFKLMDASDAYFQIFDVDDEIKTAQAGYIYLTEDSTSSEFTRHVYPVIVRSMETTLNEDGDAECTIETYYQKTTMTYSGKPEKLAGVDVGDVIRIIEDKNGKIEVVEIVYDVSEPVARDNRFVDFNGSSKSVPYFTGYPCFYGTVLSNKDGYLRFTLSTVDDEEYAFDPTYYADNLSVGSAKIYKYSNLRGVVSVGEATTSDIVTYAQNNEYPSKVIFNYNHNAGGLNWVLILEVQED